MNKTSERLWASLRRLHNFAVAVGMTAFLEGETAFLFVLKNYGEKEATPSELSEDMNVTKGRITAIINSLARKGFVRLEKVNSDGRKVNVRITEAGMNDIDTRLARIDEALDELIAAVGKDKVEQMTDLLAEMCAEAEVV